MQHPILGIIFDLFMGIFALAAAYWVVAPMVDKAPPAKKGLLAAIWVALLVLVPLLSAYGASFLEDKNVTYLTELGHAWPIDVMLLGGIFVSLYRRWRKQSL